MKIVGRKYLQETLLPPPLKFSDWLFGYILVAQGSVHISKESRPWINSTVPSEFTGGLSSVPRKRAHSSLLIARTRYFDRSNLRAEEFLLAYSQLWWEGFLRVGVNRNPIWFLSHLPSAKTHRAKPAPLAGVHIFKHISLWGHRTFKVQQWTCLVFCENESFLAVIGYRVGTKPSCVCL